MANESERDPPPETNGNAGANGNGEADTAGSGTASWSESGRAASAAFGAMVSMMMKSPAYHHHSLVDLEWLLVPAILNNQFMLNMTRTESGASIPGAFTIWAQVSEDVDRRLSANPAIPLRLSQEEWKSGDIVWLIEAIGPEESVTPMVQRLHAALAENQPMKMRVFDKDGQPKILALN